MAAVGGTVSEATGGKFANGAVSGAFVHLFNAENMGQKFTNAAVKAYYKIVSNFSASLTGSTNLHIGIVGINASYDGNALTTCARVGPGFMVSAGFNAVATVSDGTTGSPYSVGVGGDYANGFAGFGGAVSTNGSNLSGVKAWRGVGAGVSTGIDFCYTY